MYPHQNFTRIPKLCSNRPESTCSKNYSPKTANCRAEYLPSTFRNSMEVRDCRVHGLGVTLPLHGRYKAVTLRSCNVDPCIRTRISRGFQNCAQIDLNQHARKTIRQKPQIALPSTCRVPASTLQNSWNLRDRCRRPNLLYTDPHP